MLEQSSAPIILYEKENTLADLENLKKNHHIWEVYDIYELQLEEFFKIKNPFLIGVADYKNKLRIFIQAWGKCSKGRFRGSWVYFPWNGVLLHILNECDYYSLRTNRNKNLITSNEQKKLNDFTVGIVGLSVGSGIASVLAYSGISKNMKLAEFDLLDTTNLNRMRVPAYQVGRSKIDIIKEQIFEIDPYARISIFSDGLTKNNLNKFLYSLPKPKLIFEIIDNFEMKIHLRLATRKAHIPVISFANLGDGILVDIERYDENEKLPLFNGIMNEVIKEILRKPDNGDKVKNEYAVKLVGLKNIPKRALESVKEIGKTLVGRPQLMSTVNLSASLGAYFARRIALDQSLPSGRKFIDFKTFF